MTIHNEASKQDVANVVIMPGDPLRAKWIANEFLDDAVMINDVRGMLGFTGYYNNKKITVMGHGMGVPSIGIYAMELFNPELYDVEKIIRIGSCGSYDKNIKVGDVFIGNEAYGLTIFHKLIKVEAIDNILKPDTSLYNKAVAQAKKMNVPYKVGRVLTKDAFYIDDTVEEIVSKYKIQVAEMESFGLFACAKKFNKKALTLLTVSNSHFEKKSYTAKERESNLRNMIELALKVAINED